MPGKRKGSILITCMICMMIITGSPGCTEDLPSPTTPVFSDLSTSVSEISEICVISDHYVQFIYPGISADSVLRLAGLDPISADEIITELYTEDGRKIEFRYDEILSLFADLIIITDNTGEQELVPIPDDGSAEEFSIVCDSVTLRLNSTVAEDELLTFGAINDEIFTSGSGDEAYGEWRKREVDFEDVSLVLVQLREKINSDSWRIWEITARSPESITPRGLKPGIGIVEALRKLGTGDIIYDLYLNSDGEEITGVAIRKLDDNGYLIDYYEMSLAVSEGLITEINMRFMAP